MDVEIALQDLTIDHLLDAEYVDACTKTDRVRVWVKNSLPRFVTKDETVSETKTLFLRVTSIADADVTLLAHQIHRLWQSRSAQ